MTAELAPAFHVSEGSSRCIRRDAFFREVEKLTLFLDFFHIKIANAALVFEVELLSINGKGGKDEL